MLANQRVLVIRSGGGASCAMTFGRMQPVDAKWVGGQCVRSPYSSVVEHSLRKRKVGGSIPPGGNRFLSACTSTSWSCVSLTHATPVDLTHLLPCRIALILSSLTHPAQSSFIAATPAHPSHPFLTSSPLPLLSSHRVHRFFAFIPPACARSCCYRLVSVC